MPQIMYYEFGSFRLDPVKRVLVRDGERIKITAKAFDMLLALVESGGQPLSREELKRKVWSASQVTDNNFDVTLSAVRKALGESAHDHQYIVTRPEGYCFVASVREVQSESSGLVKEESVNQYGPAEANQQVLPSNIEELSKDEVPEVGSVLTPARSRLSFNRHLWHMVISCTLYALLYVVALLVEIAYEFDYYKNTVLKIASLIFLWVFITSLGGLAFGWKWTTKGKGRGWALSFLIFLAAASVLLGGICLYLPSSPVTQLSTQAHTAQAAYLKAVCYFLILATFFLVGTFHFVAALQRDLQFEPHRFFTEMLRGTKFGMPPIVMIYWRLWVLILMLSVMFIITLFLHFNLLDKLVTTKYTNLFMILIYVRAILYFALGIQCLTWYYRVLNDFKQEALQAESLQVS
jgi:DNA-binding winged helix-turn-helix (wHTH) protein